MHVCNPVNDRLRCYIVRLSEKEVRKQGGGTEGRMGRRIAKYVYSALCIAFCIFLGVEFYLMCSGLFQPLGRLGLPVLGKPPWSTCDREWFQAIVSFETFFVVW